MSRKAASVTLKRRIAKSLPKRKLARRNGNILLPHTLRRGAGADACLPAEEAAHGERPSLSAITRPVDGCGVLAAGTLPTALHSSGALLLLTGAPFPLRRFFLRAAIRARNHALSFISCLSFPAHRLFVRLRTASLSSRQSHHYPYLLEHFCEQR